MQFYTYDRVEVREGVVDEDGTDLSGKEGRISKIGYRDEKYPFTVDIYNSETGFYEEYFLSEKELKLEN